MEDNEESSTKGSVREAAMEKDGVSEAKIVLPAKASANAAAPPKKPPHRKPTKRPPGMPRRALTAYNLFFQEERMLILEEKAKRVFRPAEDDDVDKPKRGGKLAGVIAGRWKHISPRRLARFKELAAVDAQRHSREMEEYQKRVAAEYLGAKQEKETSVVDVAIEDQQLPSSSSPSYKERVNDIPTAGPNMHLQDDRSTRSSSPVQQEQQLASGAAASWLQNPSSPLHTNHPRHPLGEITEQLVGDADTNLSSAFRATQPVPTHVLMPPPSINFLVSTPSIFQHGNFVSGNSAHPTFPSPNVRQLLQTLQAQQGEPRYFQTLGGLQRPPSVLPNTFAGESSVYEQELPQHLAQPHQHQPHTNSLTHGYAVLQQLLGRQQQGQHQRASTQNDPFAALSFLGYHSSSMSRQERR